MNPFKSTHQMAEESTMESLIKRKLLIDNDGTGDEKRLQIFIKQVTKWIYSEESPAESEISCNTLLAQLGNFELNRRKSDLINDRNTKQMAKYKMMQETFKERTELIKKDIENQQELLKRAKIVKKNRMERELLAQTIKEHPSRKDLENKIEELKREIAIKEKEKKNLDYKLNSSVKQCAVLSTSANALKSSIEGVDLSSESLEADVVILGTSN